MIPLGLTGALLALLTTGYTLSFTSIIGIIALVGIEIKNSILLVDFTNRLRARGMSDLYVIMLTSKDGDVDYERAYQAGVDDYL